MSRLSVRLSEHKANVIKFKSDNGIISNHVINSGHKIDFINASLIYNCNDFKFRKILESAFISVNFSNCLNLNLGSYPLGNYICKRLLHSIKHKIM